MRFSDLGVTGRWEGAPFGRTAERQDDGNQYSHHDSVLKAILIGQLGPFEPIKAGPAKGIPVTV